MNEAGGQATQGGAVDVSVPRHLRGVGRSVMVVPSLTTQRTIQRYAIGKLELDAALAV